MNFSTQSEMKLHIYLPLFVCALSAPLELDEKLDTSLSALKKEGFEKINELKIKMKTQGLYKDDIQPYFDKKIGSVLS